MTNNNYIINFVGWSKVQRKNCRIEVTAREESWKNGVSNDSSFQRFVDTICCCMFSKVAQSNQHTSSVDGTRIHLHKKVKIFVYTYL